MSPHFHLQPESLRARAEVCRVQAEKFRDDLVKAKMLDLANGYDRMAEAAENLAREASILRIDQISASAPARDDQWLRAEMPSAELPCIATERSKPSSDSNVVSLVERVGRKARHK